MGFGLGDFNARNFTERNKKIKEELKEEFRRNRIKKILTNCVKYGIPLAIFAAGYAFGYNANDVCRNPISVAERNYSVYENKTDYIHPFISDDILHDITDKIYSNR